MPNRTTSHSQPEPSGPPPRRADQSPGRAASDAGRADASVPEWETEEWKHRIEAEARHRVKSEIRGVSRHR